MKFIERFYSCNVQNGRKTSHWLLVLLVRKVPNILHVNYQHKIFNVDYYKFTAEFDGERIYKSSYYSAKLQVEI